MAAKRKKRAIGARSPRTEATAPIMELAPMLDRQRVRYDIALAMRDVVVRSTPFSVDNYVAALIPSKPPMKGWEANLPNWGMTLRAVEARLHQVAREYHVLVVTLHDAESTLDKALADTIEILTDKVIAAGRAIQAGGEPGS